MYSFRQQFSIIIFLLFFAGYQATNRINGNEESYVQDDEKVPALNDYRLPKTVIPTLYEILLMPELEKDFKFQGIVHIHADIKRPTDTIALHVGRIEITLLSVKTNLQNLENLKCTYNNETEKCEIKLNEVLSAGTKVIITFNYNGKLRDDMIGFYKSSYVDSSGKVRWLLATQFQTTHARHAFPCFDEPSFKASFIIRILRPREYTSISNMPLNESLEGGDKVWDEFVQSIPMSTYLVAFMISDFESIKVDNFKVWARPNAIHQAHYALNIGTQGLNYLSKRFKQEYQISKMDMAAIPDFSAGAMENWGLITYRESRLLYDEATTSDAAKQRIASVIVHELTHMWFGNQITPEWWSYLWLSEAFARYFQYFGTAQIEKSWNMEEQFIVEQHQTAYAADGIEISKPMTRDVSNSAQISGAGDTITYNKGASIVRMMNLIFGSDVFDVGLQNYLSNNEEKVARPDHLWAEFQKEINRNDKGLNASVKEIMTTWTEQPGFPVVSVSIKDGVATLHQERFLLRNLRSTPTDKTWWIPLTWVTKENPNFNAINVGHWMSKERDTVILGESSDWVIFNVQSSGFYRVNYDNASWYRIFNVLDSANYKDIHVLNRAALVDDLLNLARVNLLPYKTALDGLQYLKREKNYLPFKAALSGLTYLDQRLSGHNEYYKFKRFVLNLIEDIYKEVGYVDRPSDDALTVLLREELNKWACNYGHEGCVNTFTTMFQQWKNNNTAIKPNQQSIAYCMGMKHGTKENWEFLWNQYYESNSAIEQEVLLKALGCSQNTAALEKYLLYALKNFEESRIRMQDNSAVFSAVSSTGTFGAEFVLDFVAKHSAEMIKFYNGAGSISGILSTASQRFSTQKLIDRFENLIDRQKAEFHSVLESLTSSLQVAKYELQWLKKNAGQIMSWVNKFNNDTTYTEDYRLPTSIIPNSYTISVATDLKEGDYFAFTGTVIINAGITYNTRNITLHSADLVHNSISVSVDDKQVNIIDTKIEETYDFLIIEVDEELKVGQKLLVTIDFTGHLNDEMRGFYKSWYVDSENRKRWLAATHMEPVGARKMFPCFDEPAMKAKFTIKATVPQDYSAVSNMPVNEMYMHRDEKKTIVFKETPTMSTYLVALVVSDFASVKDENEFYGVWARQNAIDDGKYALSVMEPLVKFYQQSLNFPYELPKLDMVALPDFVSGAMENWGLLTYKERNVLYNSNLSTTVSEQSIVNVISHEITHQWFGNLVSPKWWKYLWLNEGFARYFQYHGTDSIRKTWNLESQFVVEQLHSAFEADSTTFSHAMSHDVFSPTEIRGIFDSISYNKAASVIRMMEKIFGRQVFYKSLQHYLNAQRHGVATPEDLFNAFKEELIDQRMKDSIHDIMNSWTTQPGYPIVHATIRDNSLELKQQRFFWNAQDAKAETTWHVPITWTALNKPNFTNLEVKYWLKDAEGNVSLPSNNLYILNLQQSGFYRTNYDVETWQKIIAFLKSDQYSSIHEINRAAIIDDLLNLGKAGYIDYSIVLSATEYLKKEDSYIPWRAFFNGLTYLHKQFEGKNGYDAFERYISSLLTPLYYKYGFEDGKDDTHVVKLFRSHIRKWACKLDLGDCNRRALASFASDNFTEFQVNTRSVQYCALAKLNTEQNWNLLMSLYEKANFAAQKSIILQSFACSTNTTLLNRLLETAIGSSSLIRFEDASSVFTSVINEHPVGVKCVMEFIQNNYDKMVNYFKQVSSVRSIVNSIGKKVFDKQIYTQYTDLLKFLELKESTHSVNLASYMDYAALELKWGQNNIPKIYEWLDTNYPTTNYRLSSMFSPLRYHVSLSPYFEEKDFTFDGNVQIEIKASTNYVSRIVLHSDELTINNISVHETNSNLTKGKELRIRSLNHNYVSQMLSIYLENFIESENIILDIDFTGTLNNKLEGFYRSYYYNSEGMIRWLATTQFEPTYARRAFPCFDEPRFKAKFVINIERPKDYIVLSNMPRVSLIPSNASDRVWESFQETVQMSTYLIAFVVSDFNPVRDSYSTVNVWGRPGISAKGDFAQIAAMRILDYLHLETGHEYTLPKLDLVGIPDFTFGAMENWGLATFREYGLFYQRDVTTAKYTDYIITIIAHELAHMLYGNLVTCDWWDYIWLNEGFAEYMQWRLAHLFRPGFGYEDLFVVDELQPALLNDGSESTHPVNNHVSKPADIANIFDTVTYGKGSSIIRMIQRSLKPEIFTLTMNRYLDQHKFSTVIPNDLWLAFDNVISATYSSVGLDMPMKKLMHGWTEEKGYPVVWAQRNGTYVTLEQRSFFTNKRTDAFWIPITMTTASKLDFVTTWTDTWLGGYDTLVKLDKPNDWYIINIRQSGYYRVNYDSESWSRLIQALKKPNHSSIHVTNRAQIIDDLFNLARSNYVTYKLVLDAITYLAEEENYLPWKAFFNGMNFILQRFEGRMGQHLIEAHIKDLGDRLFEELGFVDSDAESHFDQLNRDLILTWMCKLGHERCVWKSAELFANWRSTNINRISPNARPAVYCTAIRNGKAEDWEFLWRKYAETEFASEKKIIMESLGCSEDENILKSYIKYIETSNSAAQIRRQDISALLASIYNSGKLGVDVVLDFLVKDYKKLYEYYGSWDEVNSIISKVASRLSVEYQISMLNELLKKSEADRSNIATTVNSAIKSAQKNLEWYKNHADNILEVLQKYNTNEGTTVVANKLSIIFMTVFSIIVYILSS